MRVVYDTNTYISGIFWKGPPRKLLKAAATGKVELFISEAILREIKKVLKNDFDVDEPQLGKIVTNIAKTATTLKVNRKVNAVKADPSDNKILACALKCHADYIVSGDHHLLSLNEYKGIKIIKARSLLEMLR
ncbi:MAG: putative toxin-antitoxin system toxin component, PIN family [Euryarchaeota archaeon]|nr:putative toxin-antitoxin system toxin component, PIN family [Euryarchaeota archaeon]